MRALIETTREKWHARQTGRGRAVELRVTWNGVLKTLLHLPQDRRRVQFRLGEDPSCDFPVPAELLGGVSSFTVMTCTADNGICVHVPPQATGALRRSDGSHETIDSTGSRHVAPGECCTVHLGPFDVEIRNVDAPAPFVAPLRIKPDGGPFIFLSLVLHALVMTLIFLQPPDPEGLSFSATEKNLRFLAQILSVHEARVQQFETPRDSTAQATQNTDTGRRHSGSEGKSGSRHAPATGRRYGIIGPADNRNPTMARETQRDTARETGILVLLRNAIGPLSPFGVDNPIGADPENALGNLTGAQIGNSSGYDGLAINGMGRGGGGDATGTIGVSPFWGRIGRDGTSGGPGGPHAGMPALANRRPGGPVRPLHGNTVIKGSLSPEVIRRVVQQHINEVKFCYEKQLVSRPDLSGRIAIRFLINGTGSVQTAVVAESTVGNAALENCIANAVRRWTFPVPQDRGMVFVTYPFALSNAGE